MYSPYQCNLIQYLKIKSNCNAAKQDRKELTDISFKNQFGIAVTGTPHFSLKLKLGTPFVLIAEKN